jgi:hypothetical protein
MHGWMACDVMREIGRFNGRRVGGDRGVKYGWE